MRRIEELNNSEEKSYYRKLNNQKVQIRRSQRQTAFNRKRNNFTPTQHLHKELNSKQNEKQENEENTTNQESNSQVPQQQNNYIIVDEQYHDDITKANNYHYTVESLSQLFTLIRSKQIVDLIYGATGLRKLLSENVEVIQKVFEAEVVDVLIELTDYQESLQVQLQATWCIANIASGTTNQCQILISKGIIPRLVDLVKRRDVGVIQQAVWALGNIASDCVQFRNMLLEAEAGEAICQLILSDVVADQFKAECCWVLTNLCRGNPLPQFGKIKNPLRIICSMLAMHCITSEDIFVQSCWALSYNYTRQKDRMRDIMDFNLLETIIPIAVQIQKPEVIFPILRIVGQLSTGGFEYTDHILKKGALELLQKCICLPIKTLRRETAWLLSNLSASYQLSHLQLILSNNKIMPKMIELFLHDSEEVRNEIAYFFGNMCYAGKTLNLDQVFAQIEITLGYLSLMQSSSNKYVLQALNNLSVILEYAEKKKIQRGSGVNLIAKELITNGGVKIIQDLQYSKNEYIYLKANEILITYFQLQNPLPDQNFRKNIKTIIQAGQIEGQSELT